MPIICRRSWKYALQLSGSATTCKARRIEVTSSSPYLFAMYRRVISETGTALGSRANQLDLVICADLSLSGHGKIEARPLAREESLHHVVGLKSQAQFVARKTRLGHDHFRRTDGELVPEMD